VGSLIPIKNHSLLLSAFAEVRNETPDVALRIVGEGPLRSELQSQAAASKVEDAVTFVGECDQPTVRREMEAADAFVFPSDFETFGVAIIEAMSCGLPVIAMAAGGPEEIVTSETGLLVGPGDRGALVKAMRAVMQNRGQYDSMRIRRVAMDRWSPDVFSARLRKVYRSVLHQAHDARFSP
jgi:teichuronic acid biosynthesis glycosyltransferase TuaC